MKPKIPEICTCNSHHHIWHAGSVEASIFDSLADMER